MDSRAFRDFLFSATVAFVFWVAAYLGLVLAFSHRDVWGHLTSMPLEVALLGIVVLLFCWFLSCAALGMIRMLVKRCSFFTRMQSEVVFVIATGLGGGLMASALAGDLSALFPAWCFFSFPALVMVLAQRGLEWYRLRHPVTPSRS